MFGTFGNLQDVKGMHMVPVVFMKGKSGENMHIRQTDWKVHSVPKRTTLQIQNSFKTSKLY